MLATMCADNMQGLLAGEVREVGKGLEKGWSACHKVGGRDKGCPAMRGAAIPNGDRTRCDEGSIPTPSPVELQATFEDNLRKP